MLAGCDLKCYASSFVYLFRFCCDKWVHGSGTLIVVHFTVLAPILDSRLYVQMVLDNVLFLYGQIVEIKFTSSVGGFTQQHQLQC